MFYEIAIGIDCNWIDSFISGFLIFTLLSLLFWEFLEASLSLSSSSSESESLSEESFLFFYSFIVYSFVVYSSPYTLLPPPFCYLNFCES